MCWSASVMSTGLPGLETPAICSRIDTREVRGHVTRTELLPLVELCNGS